MSLIAALLLAAAPGPIFDCRIGAKRLSVTQQGDALVYRYGSVKKTELKIVANPASGRLFYHRTLYARGEDQTLRFINGDYNYIVYAHWTAPSGNGDGLSLEVFYGGLIVMRGETELSSRSCTSGGDMREWPIFKALPKDEENRTPAL